MPSLKIRMGISEVTSSQSKYESCRAHSINTQDGIRKEMVRNTHNSLQLFGNKERITTENRKPMSEWLCNSYWRPINLRYYFERSQFLMWGTVLDVVLIVGSVSHSVSHSVTQAGRQSGIHSVSHSVIQTMAVSHSDNGSYFSLCGSSFMVAR